MNVARLEVTQEAARAALLEYRQHRGVYDKRDVEIERIYRAIARGKQVISVRDSIVNAGLDSKGRPLLAICRADAERVHCDSDWDKVTFGVRPTAGWKLKSKVEVNWPGMRSRSTVQALLPRIPPQHRPAHHLSNYHVLWEADWSDIPVDPYLLRRIGEDAWVVLAAWALTDVEMNVLRAHRPTE